MLSEDDYTRRRRRRRLDVLVGSYLVSSYFKNDQIG